jgi:hypothetical protein
LSCTDIATAAVATNWRTEDAAKGVVRETIEERDVDAGGEVKRGDDCPCLRSPGLAGDGASALLRRPQIDRSN